MEKIVVYTYDVHFVLFLLPPHQTQSCILLIHLESKHRVLKVKVWFKHLYPRWYQFHLNIYFEYTHFTFAQIIETLTIGLSSNRVIREVKQMKPWV